MNKEYVACVLSHVQLLVTSWTVAYQVPLSMRFSRQEIPEWVVISRTTGSFQHRDLTHISWMGRRILYHCAPWEACKENVWFVHTHTNTHTHAHMGVSVHARTHTQTHTHDGIFIYPRNLFIYYLSPKKKEILLFVTTWMNLEDIIISEISQSQKAKCCMIALIWDIKNSQIHKSRTQNGGCWNLGGGEMGSGCSNDTKSCKVNKFSWSICCKTVPTISTAVLHLKLSCR